MKKTTSLSIILCTILMLSGTLSLASAAASSGAACAIAVQTQKTQYQCSACNEIFHSEDKWRLHAAVHELGDKSLLQYGLWSAQQMNLSKYGPKILDVQKDATAAKTQKSSNKRKASDTASAAKVDKKNENSKTAAASDEGEIDASSDDSNFDPNDANLESSKSSDDSDVSSKPKAKRLKKDSEGNFVCPKCDKAFTDDGNLRRHIRNVHNKMKSILNHKVKCDICQGIQSNVQNWIRHKRDRHDYKPYKCDIGSCEQEFAKEGDLKNHFQSKHKKFDWNKKKYCVNYKEIISKFGINTEKTSSAAGATAGAGSAASSSESDSDDAHDASFKSRANVQQFNSRDHLKRAVYCSCRKTAKDFPSFRDYIRHFAINHKDLNLKMFKWNKNSIKIWQDLRDKRLAKSKGTKIDLIGGSIFKPANHAIEVEAESAGNLLAQDDIDLASTTTAAGAATDYSGDGDEAFVHDGSFPLTPLADAGAAAAASLLNSQTQPQPLLEPSAHAVYSSPILSSMPTPALLPAVPHPIPMPMPNNPMLRLAQMQYQNSYNQMLIAQEQMRLASAGTLPVLALGAAAAGTYSAAFQFGAHTSPRLVAQPSVETNLFDTLTGQSIMPVLETDYRLIDDQPLAFAASQTQAGTQSQPSAVIAGGSDAASSTAASGEDSFDITTFLKNDADHSHVKAEGVDSHAASSSASGAASAAFAGSASASSSSSAMSDTDLVTYTVPKIGDLPPTALEENANAGADEDL